MNKIQLARLRKLANHLAGDKPLGVLSFYFNIFYRPSDCGCALGECTFLFPRSWELDTNGNPILKGKYETYESARAFFGLAYHEYNHLFFPNYQMNDLYGGIPLGDKATRQEVAANMFEFLKRTQNAEK